jgi:hypothetical protein
MRKARRIPASLMYRRSKRSFAGARPVEFRLFPVRLRPDRREAGAEGI